MALRFLAGKMCELLGLFMLAAALLAGLGLTPGRSPSLAKELVLLVLGLALFTLGWRVARAE